MANKFESEREEKFWLEMLARLVGANVQRESATALATKADQYLSEYKQRLPITPPTTP